MLLPYIYIYASTTTTIASSYGIPGFTCLQEGPLCTAGALLVLRSLEPGDADLGSRGAGRVQSCISGCTCGCSCMYICTHICMYVCMKEEKERTICVHVHTYFCLCIYTHTYVYVCMHIRIYIYTYVHFPVYIMVYRHMCTRMCLNTKQKHVFVYVYVYIYTHMYLYIYIYIYIYVSRNPENCFRGPFREWFLFCCLPVWTWEVVNASSSSGFEGQLGTSRKAKYPNIKIRPLYRKSSP